MSFQLNQFIEDNMGVPGIGDTPENIGQCVGLVEVYTDALGLSHTWGNAADLIANADPNLFVKVYNTPDGVPARGDIFCFDGTYGEGAGHTGIVVNATKDRVTLFQQNDPAGHAPSLTSYGYAHAIGWLHPKVLDATNAGGDMTLVDNKDLAALVAHAVLLRPTLDDELWNSIKDQPVETVLAALDKSAEHVHIIDIFNDHANLVQKFNDLSLQAQTQQEKIDQLAGTNKALMDANEELQRELEHKAPPTPVLTQSDIQGPAVPPPSLEEPPQSSDSPINIGNFSMSQYNKSLVALVGVAVTVATTLIGVNSPLLQALVSVLVALGVYSTPNKQ